MKRFLLVIILLCAAGGGYLWYREASKSETEKAMERLSDAASDVLEKSGETARALSDSIREQIDKWDLDTESIKDELAGSGEIVRDKLGTIGEVVKESTGDAVITSKIKTKLAISRNLSAWKINVDTDDGEVTLNGTVKSEEHVAEAVALALDQKGVKKVTARLKIEP